MRKKIKTEVGSCELTALREEVKKLKTDHDIKLQQVTHKYHELRQNYMRKLKGENCKKKKFFGRF